MLQPVRLELPYQEHESPTRNILKDYSDSLHECKSVPAPTEFIFIALHTRPDDTKAELEHLISATENITSVMGVDVSEYLYCIKGPPISGFFLKSETEKHSTPITPS